MQHSKMFIVSLLLALSALVAATATVDVSADSIVAKRAALNARMHQRQIAGHGALKRRQPTESELVGKERIRRAQYHPATRTATPVVESADIEKRQLGGIGNIGIGIGSGNTGVGVGVGNGLGCVVVGGIQIGLGCTNNNSPKPSSAVCRGSSYDGCSPGANYGTGAGYGGSGSAAGVSQCCQSGYTCQQVGPFSQSICLNLPFARLYDLNRAIDRQNFGTQQQFGDYLSYLRNGGTF